MEILAATKVPNEIAAGKRCCKRSGSACPSWISVTYPAWIFAANEESMQDTVLFPEIHQAYIPMSGRFRCAQSSHDAGVQAVNILARIGNDYLHFSGNSAILYSDGCGSMRRGRWFGAISD